MKRTSSISLSVSRGGPSASSTWERRCSFTADAVKFRRACLTPFTIIPSRLRSIDPVETRWSIGNGRDVRALSGSRELPIDHLDPVRHHLTAGHAGTRSLRAGRARSRRLESRRRLRGQTACVVRASGARCGCVFLASSWPRRRRRPSPSGLLAVRKDDGAGPNGPSASAGPEIIGCR